jgi:uncharacterized membrane protein
MSSELAQQIACPECHGPIAIDQPGRYVTCDICGRHLLLPGHLCPNCSCYSEIEQALCSQCGVVLNRICPECATANWAGNENCLECGAPLDILDVLGRQGSQATVRRLNQQMSESQRIKEIEQSASEKRMAELLAIEEARQAEIKRRIQKQKEQERQLFILVFAAVTLFLIVLLIYAYIIS